VTHRWGKCPELFTCSPQLHRGPAHSLVPDALAAYGMAGSSSAVAQPGSVPAAQSQQPVQHKSPCVMNCRRAFHEHVSNVPKTTCSKFEKQQSRVGMQPNSSRCALKTGLRASDWQATTIISTTNMTATPDCRHLLALSPVCPTCTAAALYAMHQHVPHPNCHTDLVASQEYSPVSQASGQ